MVETAAKMIRVLRRPDSMCVARYSCIDRGATNMLLRLRAQTFHRLPVDREYWFTLTTPQSSIPRIRYDPVDALSAPARNRKTNPKTITVITDVKKRSMTTSSDRFVI